MLSPIRFFYLLVLYLLCVENISAQQGYHWINPAGGNWNTDGNWSLSGYPGSGDTAYIDLNGTYTVTYNQNFASVAAVYLGASSGIQTLINPGNVNGATGSVTIGANGAFIHTGGTYSAPSVLNYGTVRFIGTSFSFSPRIINFDSVLVVASSFNLSGGLSNHDSVFVLTGSLNISGTDTSYAGAFLVSSGATLNFNSGTHTLDASSTITGAGNVTFNTTVNMNGTYNIAGTTSSTGGTTTFNGAPGTLISLGDSL
ncbi:MAG: hypothetical protein KDC45_14400, partial [Bacteroidetes bacterium]|nr:hypothetical protein [Bacteroidota bacterium]